MTGGSTEVSKKIRTSQNSKNAYGKFYTADSSTHLLCMMFSLENHEEAAIKAKLEELGVYVDDELPDYIMVMIANKKEKTQMKEDLLLFLGKNSGKFVDWLFDIFERLQSVGSQNPQTDTNEGKKRELEVSSYRKEPETSSKREKVETVDKKKRRDSSERVKSVRKEPERKDKERERSTKESEKKESEKRGSIAKVVKSKPSHKIEKSPVLPPERTRRHRRSESPEKHRVHLRSGTRRDTSEKNDRKVSIKSKAESRTEHESKEDARESRKRTSEKDKPPRKVTADKAPSDSRHGEAEQRKRKAASPILDDYVDEEESFDDESARILSSKKVQSSAVVKLPPEPSVKSVSSQVVVKRKLPEKETATKESRGVKSLFLKAIKEAGETTRTASQIAGYCGAATVKKEKEIADFEKNKQTGTNGLDDEEGIEIDVYDDIGDALVVKADEIGAGNVNVRSVVQAADECTGSEPEVERKRPRIYGPNSTEEPKFYITLKGDSIAGLAKKLTKIGEENVENLAQKIKPKKRRNDANPILAHLNISQTRKVKRELAEEKIIVNNAENERRLVESPDESLNDTRPLPAWDLQIQLPEGDTSDEGDDDGDDEAQIDAVLASAQKIDQNEVPPTPTLSTPTFCHQSPPPQLFYSPTRQDVFTLNRQASNNAVISGGTEKIIERCKFWPNCSLQNCVYIHPSKPCSSFPKCTFGERCIYIHPTCKFDRLCLNPKCIFTHTSRTTKVAATSSVASSATVIEKASVKPNTSLSYSASIPCKFGGKCANASCSFKHPKLCRFGDRCTNRACYFWHPKASALAVLSATGGKFKWKAPNTATR